MTWEMVTNPLGNIALSALVDALPIFFLFFALAIMRMKGHWAGLITALIAIGIAIMVHQMPAGLALGAAAYGALFGLWPIGWIVITAVFLYNLTVKTGQFEIIKDSIASITDDRRLQALLIAFSFGAFLEGAAGFGTPVAISAAMLVGLGFNPLYAAGICLIANTAPVAFGGVGIPIITAGAVTGIEAMQISKMVGRQLPFLTVMVPFWLVFIMAGWRKTIEVLPAILVSGVSFALGQWFSANYLSPMLPDIIASLLSIISLVLFLRVWKPRSVWRFKDEPPATLQVKRHSPGVIFKAWSPFIILTVLIGDWGLNNVKALLDKYTLKFPMAIDQLIIAGGKPVAVVFKFNWLQATGTSILLAAVITALILRISPAMFCRTFWETLKSLRFALLTIASVLAFAYVANWSGITPTLGQAFTVTGALFPFMSAFLGWLGVLITGSDTSANALFGNMQKVTAESMGINPVLAVATNSSGGVAGKMISPQSIAVGCASTGLVGKEGDLFRFTIAHSILFTTFIGMLSMLQAYVFPGIIPEAIAQAKAAAATAAQGATTVLLITGIIVAVLAAVAARQSEQRA
ncbi:MAG: L-lactate permease [Desulfurispora sp.]|uniref:L-lactate permease n=1 Tax=Desulfurispora sp. TaxID=3014275 RepID=UPI00404928BF